VTTVDVSSGAAYAGREANHALSFRQFNASKHAQYFTPLWFADLLFEVLQPFLPHSGLPGMSVLDPTCGSGRLLAPWKTAGATVLGIELDSFAADHARFALGPQNVLAGDILDYRDLLTGYSLVLTNPPYGLWWTPPDAGELWQCETSGGLIESQGATLEICTRALEYNGILAAIIPSSTFKNPKGRSIRENFYANYRGLVHATLPDLFAEEYGIGIEVDLVVGQRGVASRWEPYRTEITSLDAAPEELRYAFQRAHRSGTVMPASRAVQVPVVSRLFSVSTSHAVRVTPKGLKAAADVEGLLAFLDETVNAFDPVRGIKHGIVSALLSPASLLTIGPRAGVETLAWLGFEPSISEADQLKITRLQKKFALLRTPLYRPEAHQRLAYLEDRSYTAKETVYGADGEPCFTAGGRYHLRPSWVRNRETASVETVYDDRTEKHIQLITSLDRGYLAFEVITDSGARTFREVDAADVELLTAAFDLPDVPDLEAVVPSTLAQNRAIVAREAPFLFPFQSEDVARLAVKPFGYLGYEQGGGKTVTSASWARTRGFKRVLVVCSSGLIDNWINELEQFGFAAKRLTSHSTINAIQDEKRRKLLPAETTFYVTSFEFLSLTGARIYDPWVCKQFTRDGEVQHEATNTRASCSECKRAYATVIDACPKCSEVAAWTGGRCNGCGYQAWAASPSSKQWPAYRRIKKLFGAVLVDEAQLAKSKNTLRGRAVRAMRPKGKLILTGTIMKGYATDIFWNVAWLLGFDNPLFPYAYRGGPKRFLNEFGTYEYVTRQFEETLHEGRAKLLPEVSNLNRFWRLMASFTVRRLKDDIYDLPPKHREVVLLGMDAKHRPFYGSYAEWAQTAIAKALREGDGTPNMGVISNALWKLRYAATCPVAVDYLNPALDAASWNKLEYVLSYVRRAAEKGEKTIVFSGLRTMVAAMVTHLTAYGISVMPITANVPPKKRFGLIREFSRSPDLAVIVASLNCLNRGYTITAANHVILVDLEYSPEATDQAPDRVHRPGQTKDVFVKVLLSSDTIDQVMHEVITQKAEAIKHAIDGKARFLDVAEILKRVTGDVQMEVAKRIQLLPPPAPIIELYPPEEMIESTNIVAFPIAALVEDEFSFAGSPTQKAKHVQLTLFASML
jgi:hypothetical protein